MSSQAATRSPSTAATARSANTSSRGNERIEEVWFRGAHCDIAGGWACATLADIALDWVLDGAVRAGATVRPAPRRGAGPTDLDALAERAHDFVPVAAGRRAGARQRRHVPARASGVRRLPAQVLWADVDWLARGERLVRTAEPPMAAAERHASPPRRRLPQTEHRRKPATARREVFG